MCMNEGLSICPVHVLSHECNQRCVCQSVYLSAGSVRLFWSFGGLRIACVSVPERSLLTCTHINPHTDMHTHLLICSFLLYRRAC